jgi:acyl-[acyl-carrier-protein]-phospholipid O-acyltransferase/long-chain-fatty-acid--[acyl-carrier-protein] ligase
MADQKVPEMRYFKGLVGAILFARKLRSIVGDRERVGLLIPQSVGASLSNIAVLIMGKTPVNLNYTASADAIRYAADLCEIEHVLTSREFLKRMPVEVPGEPVYLEDVRETVTRWDQLIAFLLAALCPVRLLERLMGSPGGRSVEDVATIIFSSGSEGDPKGVMLTHHNIISNVEQPLQVFPYERTDRMMGIIPFFHSLGFMGTLWLPLCTGMGVIFHPNPLEAKPIGQLVYKYKPRFLIATPTFLQNFIRRCLPEELSSLEYVIVGAEKLPARIRKAFQAKFGVAPLEGYGTTECAPLVSLNVPDFRAPGYYQVGTKHETVGHPMPGQAVRIIDQDTGEEILDDRPGVLLVKGPNIMPGYYKKPEKTAEVLQDRWYNTGDVAFVDEDGFLTITGRVSRFSKIAGEMVSHARVEDELHRLLGLTNQAFCVASVPDVRKGERLVVLHTVGQEEVQDLFEKLDDSALPNLWRPRAADFYRIEEIPILGTGKVDLKRLNKMAQELDIGE